MKDRERFGYFVRVLIDEVLVRKYSYVLRYIHFLLVLLLEFVEEDFLLLVVDDVEVEHVVLVIVN
jgi:hypothetical protein